MAQNVTVAGASYSAVPSVVLPKTGGGTASFTDVSDTTAAASDVASGKYFYTAAGVRTLGTKADQGVSVVTTQDVNGGDIVTITGTPIVPYAWRGEEAELIRTYDMGTTLLSDTGYATWTPSTTAKSIQATSNLGTITSPALDTYEYFIEWVLESNTAYVSGTTLKTAPVRQVLCIGQSVHRKPSNLTQIAAENDNYNYCVTLFTAGLMDYYNSSGTHTMAWTSGYGIYGAATAATFSSTSSLNPTITVRAPTYNARCSTTYFSTAIAAAVAQASSTIKCKGYVYRCKRGGVAYSMYRDIVSAYNA